MTSRRINIRHIYDDLLMGSGSIGQRVRSRIDQGSPIKLYAARTLPDRNLVLEVGPVRKAYLPADFIRPRIKGLDIHVDSQIKTGSSELTLLLELQQLDAIDVFVTFVARVCEELDALEKSTDAVRAVLAVIERWKSFFSGNSELLTEGRQTGLYGELYLITHLYKAEIPLDRLIKAWTGSQRTSQDFEFGKISIEVKSTTAVDATTVSITNIRQLDDTGLASLFLNRVVLDVRQGTSHTLPALIEQLRTAIQRTAPEVSLEFEEKLLLARYKDEHAEYYSAKTYTERALLFYEVIAGFPRLLESDLPTGVTKATYELTLEACKPFNLPNKEVLAKIRDLL
jgi:hypothetical protein